VGLVLFLAFVGVFGVGVPGMMPGGGLATGRVRWAGRWRMNALVLSAVLAATPITLDQVRQESRNNLQRC
jgi:hypothetical protein